MKKVAILGHYGGNHIFYDGQTVKTKIVTEELQKVFGLAEIYSIDTFGRLNKITIFIKLIYALFCCSNIVIMPAKNGLRLIALYLYYLNKIFKRRLHYIVIGGWLPDFLIEHHLIKKSLSGFHGIYVETNKMKSSLENQGLLNTIVLPNCKNLKINGPHRTYTQDSVFHLVTFSRVMREKGIEDAIQATIKANDHYGKEVFDLTIYGQVDPNQQVWFNDLMKNVPSYIMYGGLIPFEESSSKLINYQVLLFPTYYWGEGFAGTIIDSFAAGLPVIATDWKYNSEIIENGVNGIIVPPKNPQNIATSIIELYENQEMWQEMSRKCVSCAYEYLPSKVILALTSQLL